MLQFCAEMMVLYAVLMTMIVSTASMYIVFINRETLLETVRSTIVKSVKQEEEKVLFVAKPPTQPKTKVL